MTRKLTLDIVRKEYVDNEKSTNQIADEYNCRQSTVWNWLKRYQIPRRGYDAGHYNRDVDLSSIKEILEGELLGDGCLRLEKSCKNANFRHNTKHREYLEYLQNLLSPILKFSKIYRTVNKYKNYSTVNVTYQIESMRYPSLTKLYHRWYPDSKKIIPKDLKLTPTVCRHWCIGDGYKYPAPRGITLCTDNFLREDLESFVISQLSMFKARLNKSREYYRIYIPGDRAKSFLSYIGKCPINCYKYKWGK